MVGMAMDPMPWSVDHALIMLIMWWVMMIAMMVPSATPTILLFSTIKRKQEPSGSTGTEAYIFLLGYLLAWAAFSIAAVPIQWCSKAWAGCLWRWPVAARFSAELSS
jgi:predicted metal-binding membrane protein